MHQSIKYDRARHDRDDNVPKVPDTGVSPESFVKLERYKNYPPDDDEPGQHLQEKSPCLRGNHAIKPDPESQVIRYHNQSDVEAYAEKSAVFDHQCFH